MKTNCLVLLLLLCFVPLGIAAQTDVDSIAVVEVGPPVHSSGTWTEESFSIPRYEFPERKLAYEGKEFDVRTNVLCRYNKGKKRYDLFAIEIFLKPLDITGMRCNDSIRKYGGYGTYVYHESLDLKGPCRKIKGKADAYARVFDVHPPTTDDKLELCYSVVYDAENPERNTVEYKIKKARWSKPDKDKFYYPGSFTKYNSAGWWDITLHDLCNYSPSIGQPVTMTKAKLKVSFFCFQFEKDVNPGASPNSTSPGRVNAYLDFNVKGTDKKGFCSGTDAVYSYPRSLENNTVRCTISKDNKGDVTIEERTHVFLGLMQSLNPIFPFGYAGMDFRAKAKCRKRRGLFIIEQASFSHVLYN